MSFGVRGLIEGFYRRLWTWDERGRVAEVVARAGFTTYVYAPKEDPYQNVDWRSPYPLDAVRSLQAFGDACHASGMQVWIGLRPVGISYADDIDVLRVVEKLHRYLDLGADRLMLLADDIPSQLDDSAHGRFTTLAEAHAWLVTRIIERIGVPPARFVFCPTDYHGGATPYLEHLGRTLPPEVDLCWTGGGVFSQRITRGEAEAIGSVLRRPPLVWDNYPVNDEPDRHDLRIGPIRGRDPDLDRVTQGVLVNPAMEPEISLIPLLTWAEYLADPSGYNADAAFRRALVAVAGSEADADVVATVAAGLDASVLDQGWEPPSRRELAAAVSGLAALDNRRLAEELLALVPS